MNGAEIGIAVVGVIGLVALIFGIQAASRVGAQFFPKGSTKATLGSLLSVVIIFSSFAVGITFSTNLGLLGSELGDFSAANMIKVILGYGLAFLAAYLAGKALSIAMRAVLGEPVK
jgi:hypothetical protein